MKRLYIHFLVVTVGQACNLRCKNCGNFAPFAPKETLRYDVHTILEKLKIITKFADIRLLQIQGGEPFLYSELFRILEFVKQCPSVKKCLIATNGTIIPKNRRGGGEWQILQDEKFIVRISNYPVNTDQSSRIQEWCRERGIQSELYHFVSKDDKWYNLGLEMECHTANDEQQRKAEYRFQNCLFRNCLTLENGILGRCSRSVIAKQVQGFPEKEGDYLPVEEDLEFGERLERYINIPQHMEACCHCNGTGRENLIEVALQLGKDLRE